MPQRRQLSDVYTCSYTCSLQAESAISRLLSQPRPGLRYLRCSVDIHRHIIHIHLEAVLQVSRLGIGQGSLTASSDVGYACKFALHGYTAHHQ